MTQKELLNYILEKEKLKKEDLAKLFGIRKKNTEKVLNGELSLTKRQIKNISLFTQIPEEAITREELVLPDLHNTGVVFVDEEFVKNQNTARFQNFIKNRFKIQFISLFLLKIFVYFILIFLSIFAGCAFYSAFIENIDKSTVFSAFFTLIPYLLCFASVVPIFKIIKKANYNEVKRVKIYYYLIIFANLISIISILVLNANHWGFFVSLLIGSLIPLVFLILENNKNSNKKQNKILSTILICAACFVIGSIPDYPETDREMYFRIIPAVLNLVLVATHICYWAIKDFSEFSNKFQMLNDKKCLKKKKVLHSLVSVLLVTTIVAGTTHFGMLIVLKTTIDYLLQNTDSGVNYTFEQYSEYDKFDIGFTDKEELQIIENGEVTYKIPAEFIEKTNKDQQSEIITSVIHNNVDETVIVASINQNYESESFSGIASFSEDMLNEYTSDEDVFFGESLKIMFLKFEETTKDMLVEKYGFYPENQYDFQKLGGIMNLREVNYWDKQEAVCHIPLLIMIAVAIPVYDEVYFYETEEIEGFVSIKKFTDEETGEISYSYLFDFNKKDAEWLDCRVMVRLPEELASTDLAYKIINSIELK
ncbi:MAG: APC family permease [Clostridia bacterium]|nr:APC family permease [Clostridia bacterium]